MAGDGTEKSVICVNSGDIEDGGVVRVVSDELDADVRKRRRFRPRGHEEKRGVRVCFVDMSHRRLDGGRQGWEVGVEMVD